MKAVILAGGTGTRLRPYTTILPKPLMPVGNYPISEILVRQLRHYGVNEITFAVGYLNQLIEAYFGDGKRWGVAIKYLREASPLGTAGPLAQLADFDQPLLVMNGDILTDLDFALFYRAHLDNGAEVSVATYTKTVKIDLGVVVSNRGNEIVEYLEKPTSTYQVSMGVYAFSPAVLNLIPSGERFDFPDLVTKLISVGRKVRVFPHDGLWLDIGRSEDYLAAAEVMEQNFEKLMPGASEPVSSYRVEAE